MRDNLCSEFVAQALGVHVNYEKIVIVHEGEPCMHPGCLQHLTHPCEVCHRVGGKGAAVYDIAFERRKWKHKLHHATRKV